MTTQKHKFSTVICASVLAGFFYHSHLITYLFSYRETVAYLTFICGSLILMCQLWMNLHKMCCHHKSEISFITSSVFIQQYLGVFWLWTANHIKCVKKVKNLPECLHSVWSVAYTSDKLLPGNACCILVLLVLSFSAEIWTITII